MSEHVYVRLFCRVDNTLKWPPFKKPDGHCFGPCLHVMTRSEPGDNSNVSDLAAIDSVIVIWTAAGSANAIHEGLELDVVTGLTATQRLEGIVRRVLDFQQRSVFVQCSMECVPTDVERIGDLQVAIHSMWSHHLCNVRGTASVVFRGSFGLVEFGVAGHESHIMNLPSRV